MLLLPPVLEAVLDGEEPATVEFVPSLAAPPAPTVAPPLPVDVSPIELVLVAAPVLPTVAPVAVVALVELTSVLALLVLLVLLVSPDVSPIPEAVVAADSP